MVSMAFLSLSAKPCNNCCSVVLVLTLVPCLIPKLKIRNPNERQFFQRSGYRGLQKPLNTYYQKKYAKSIDFIGLLFAGCGIKPGTIQLTQKTITNEKVLVRIGHWHFFRRL